MMDIQIKAISEKGTEKPLEKEIKFILFCSYLTKISYVAVICYGQNNLVKY